MIAHTDPAKAYMGTATARTEFAKYCLEVTTDHVEVAITHIEPVKIRMKVVIAYTES